MKITEKLKQSNFESKWPRTNLTSSRGLRPRSRGAVIRGKQSYNPSLIENKWQSYWERMGIYQPDLKNARRPFYNLMMFPYPSAEGLHVGNVYAFTGADIYGRFKRMQGYDVFEPIGLDGFGIHSENYALKIGKHPVEQAKVSEKNFYRQLHSIGNGFAWKNKLETYDPDYYRWTQWLFVKMFKAGLAYRKKSPVNFCPSCKTVLADEQVIMGVCERCKSLVEKRDLEQWFFRITRYAEKLLKNLENLDWSNKVKIAQRNWIGKKEGINITYPIVDEKGNLLTTDNLSTTLKAGLQPTTITCFTTRPDTNFGATFVVVAPEHPFVSFLPKLLKQPRLLSEIQDYVTCAKEKTEAERISEGREKTGVFTGLYCLNQLNNYKMPIYISDFVLIEFGTGAVVGVPGHDKRDFQFAKKFDIPIIRVVADKDGDTSPIVREEQVQEEEGTMINSGFLNGLDIKKAIGKMMDYLEKKGWGEKVVTYHLRDWLISRQRYWGPPIPMIFCEKCARSGLGWLSLKSPLDFARGRPRSLRSLKEKTEDLMPGWFPVPEEDLPVLLPYIEDYRPTGTGTSPLATHKEFYQVACPECGKAARRETDVSDTFLDSAWYFLRYPSVSSPKLPKSLRSLKEKDGEKPDLPQYQKAPPFLRKGGDEWRFGAYGAGFRLGISEEAAGFKIRGGSPWSPSITRRWLPVTQYTGGAEHSVLHLLYSRFLTMALHDMGYLEFDEPFSRFYAHGLIIAEGAKMSKSKGNVVIPDEYIKKYGADTLRTYLMFLGPFDAGGDFRGTGIAGMYRFLSRVWRLVHESLSPKLPRLPKQEDKLKKIMHRTIKEVTEDLENLRYNTAIAHLMEFVNELQNHNSQTCPERSREIPTPKQIQNSKSQNSKHLEFGAWNLEFVKVLLLLLAPFAPHLTEELWYRIHSSSPKLPRRLKLLTSIHQTPWPKYDPQILVEDEVTIVVQVNGKTRDVIKVPSSQLDQLDKGGQSKVVEKAAKARPKIQKYLSTPPIPPRPSKVIFVPGKLINFVI